MIFGSFVSMAEADTSYTVQPGDSLWKIAQSYGIDYQQIQQLNGITSTTIYPGQSLLISKDDLTANNVPNNTPEVSRGTSRVQTILDYARSLTGVPYQSAGSTPSGFDCSGYTQYVFAHFGVSLPRTAAEQYYMGTPVTASEAEPGDLVAFRTGNSISHIGIYLGGGDFISATTSDGVAEASVSGPYWGSHFLGYSRLF